MKVPMTDALHDELKTLKATARSVYVFCQEDGQPFTSRQALMRRVCKRAGGHYFSFHCIRRLSAGSRMVRVTLKGGAWPAGRPAYAPALWQPRGGGGTVIAAPGTCAENL